MLEKINPREVKSRRSVENRQNISSHFSINIYYITIRIVYWILFFDYGGDVRFSISRNVRTKLKYNLKTIISRILLYSFTLNLYI